MRARDIPGLAITGYGDRHYPDRAMQAGANHVLTEPIESDLLVAEARRLLGHATPTRQPVRR